jgi:ketosteroid isomerase-like protein
MSSEPLAVVQALWAAFDRFEFVAASPLLHDDFVFELPQSGERIRGRDNFIAMNAHYPGQWRIRIQRAVAQGDQVVTQCEVSDGATTVHAVSFFTVRDGQISHIWEYWPDPMEAQAWRAQWVERL